MKASWKYITDHAVEVIITWSYTVNLSPQALCAFSYLHKHSNTMTVITVTTGHTTTVATPTAMPIALVQEHTLSVAVHVLCQ